MSIEIDLVGKSTVLRRKAAIAVSQLKDKKKYCHLLDEAFNLEMNKNNWMTLCEVIKTIGTSGCNSNVLSNIEKIVFINNKEHDMITMAASTALIRLKRKNLSDVTLVIKILKELNFSAATGAYDALGYDKMIPKTNEQQIIIELSKKYDNYKDVGYGDPRYGLAAACAGWDKAVSNDFLEKCIISDYQPLKYIATYSIKGIYKKLR